MSEEIVRVPQVVVVGDGGRVTAADRVQLPRLVAGAFYDSDNETGDGAEGHPEVVRDAKFYFKRYVLGGVVLLSTLLLLLQPVHDRRPTLITIDPNGEKTHLVPTKHNEETVLIVVSGPFVADAHWANTAPEPQTKNINMQVQRIFYDDKGEPAKTLTASDSIYLHLQTDVEFDRAETVEIKHTFLLHEEATEINKGQKVETNLVMKSNSDKVVTMKLNTDNHTLDKGKGIFFGFIVLVLLYVLIIWEVVESTFAAVLCATLAVGILATLNPRPGLDEMMAWIDMETLLLLFGMMILVAILSDSGLFDAFAVYAYEISGGHIWPLINSLCLFTAILSAFLDNVTMMLLASPIIIKLCEALKLDPVAVLTFMVIYANIGAAATPVGDPPNIVITTNRFIIDSGINFGNFMLHTVPCIMIVMVQTYYQIRCGFHDIEKISMPPTPEEQRQMEAWNKAANKVPGVLADQRDVRDAMMRKVNNLRQSLRTEAAEKAAHNAKFEEILKSLKSQYFIRDKVLLFKSISAFIFVVSLFFLHSIHDFHHLSLGFTALMGAIMLLILADVEDLESMLGRVEWATLIFFAALFILMEALSQLGLIELLGGFVVDIILSVERENQLMVALLMILWISAVASAFLNNIPVTTMMLRIVISLSQNRDLKLPLHPLIWALAMGACFGGNGTLLAASANVVSAGIAIQHGYKFTFMRFFKIGFPIMIVNIIVTSGYLILAHVVFEWHDPVT